MCSSNKGISSHQLMRTLGVQYKTAWFMTHRIREAMADPDYSGMGGPGGIVEIDETIIGRKKGMPKRRGYAHKRPCTQERGYDAARTSPQRGQSSVVSVDGTKAVIWFPSSSGVCMPNTRNDR
jgi:hypothetical protein